MSLPIVSIIITNYNYASYLEGAVRSVLAQTYPEIELIIADDASTDDSKVVLERLAAELPHLKVLFCPHGGQSATARQGFMASKGDYVILLDADDRLLPRCVETHIAVHLSLRTAFAFTSGDMIQARNDRYITGTSPGLSSRIAARREQEAFIRPVTDYGPALWPFPADLDLKRIVHLVPPPSIEPWCWSPTSGNCFRREWLQILFENPDVSKLSGSVDAYLIWGAHSISGSVLIDMPLAVYNFHDSNLWSKHPPLQNMLSFDKEKGASVLIDIKKRLMEYFVRSAEILVPRLENGQVLVDALNAIDDAWPRAPATSGRGSYLAALVAEHADQLAAALGPSKYRHGSMSLKLPLAVDRWYSALKPRSAARTSPRR